MSEKKAGKSTKTARKSKGAAKRSSRAIGIATNTKKAVEQRVAALAEAPLAVCDNDENLQATLKVLRDQNEPPEVRHAALQSLQAASFSVLTFESCRGDYIAALREVVDDPDPELRQRVLGILSRENDGFAQKKLLDGLRKPEKALVPPEKALQLLSYDVHAEAYPVAREIVKNPPNTAAKREALRLLAADATAAPIFEKVLRDKTEDPEIRQISAAALHSLKPEKMQEHAREIVLDTSEQPDLQAASLTALTQFGDAEAVAKDETLLKRVDRLKGDGPTKLKQTARRFLDKYGR